MHVYAVKPYVFVDLLSTLFIQQNSHYFYYVETLYEQAPFVWSDTVVFGRPFVKRFALCYRTVVCLSCL